MSVVNLNKITLCFHVVIFISTIVIMPVSQAAPFKEGSSVATLSLGSGQFFSENYLIIGGGFGYYLLDGLETGLDVDYWSGAGPEIYQVTPRINYIFDNPSHIKPYIGAFYNRTFIEGLDDSNAIGYRAGFYSPLGARTFMGVGVVYTELQDCTETAVISCSETSTEVRLMFSL